MQPIECCPTCILGRKRVNRAADRSADPFHLRGDSELRETCAQEHQAHEHAQSCCLPESPEKCRGEKDHSANQTDLVECSQGSTYYCPCDFLRGQN